MSSWPLNQELDRLIRIVSTEMDPERIIVFGSMATGEIGEWSDLDVVVVMETTLPSATARASVVYGSASRSEQLMIQCDYKCRNKEPVMQRIGIRALKEQTSKIIRRVREDGDIFEVTYHGRAVARLVPMIEPEPSDSAAGFWQRWEQLGETISAHWPEGISATDAIHEDRREL